MIWGYSEQISSWLRYFVFFLFGIKPLALKILLVLMYCEVLGGEDIILGICLDYFHSQVSEAICLTSK